MSHGCRTGTEHALGGGAPDLPRHGDVPADHHTAANLACDADDRATGDRGAADNGADLLTPTTQATLPAISTPQPQIPSAAAPRVDLPSLVITLALGVVLAGIAWLHPSV